MIGLSASTFYYEPTVTRQEREKQDADLRAKVELVQTTHPKSGYRTMRQYLKRAGTRVGERKLRRVMKKYDLHAKLKRAFVNTTESNHSHRVYPNLLPGRTVMGLDEVWTADSWRSSWICTQGESLAGVSVKELTGISQSPPFAWQ